jgi:hypothetical protein
MGRIRAAYRILTGKPDGKSPLGRHRHRCENSKIYLKNIFWKMGGTI